MLDLQKAKQSSAIYFIPLKSKSPTLQSYDLGRICELPKVQMLFMRLIFDWDVSRYYYSYVPGLL